MISGTISEMIIETIINTSSRGTHKVGSLRKALEGFRLCAHACGTAGLVFTGAYSTLNRTQDTLTINNNKIWTLEISGGLDSQSINEY